jgi:hypothetical protein
MLSTQSGTDIIEQLRITRLEFKQVMQQVIKQPIASDHWHSDYQELEGTHENTCSISNLDKQ